MRRGFARADAADILGLSERAASGGARHLLNTEYSHAIHVSETYDERRSP
jgi:hypothetical protein